MAAEPIRVGLVGCGRAGRGIHMRLLGKHAELYRVVTCADAVGEAARTLAADFDIRAAESVEALLADSEVELVVVAPKPPTSHRDVAVPASRAGKHVVVEKPMAITLQDCDAIIDAARNAHGVSTWA